MSDDNAYLLRENTGTTGLERTARTVAELLAHFAIPHLIVGGFAVQEHGYPRLTVDLDIVVPDVREAVEFLTGDLSGPFGKEPGCEDRLIDRRNQVKIDFLPAGGVLKEGCKVSFPYPQKVRDRPQIIDLETLISLKLDSWANSPLRRHQDKSDVLQLISRRNLQRDLEVAPAVADIYRQTWDALRKET